MHRLTMLMNELQTMPYYFSDEIAFKPYNHAIQAWHKNLQIHFISSFLFISIIISNIKACVSTVWQSNCTLSNNDTFIWDEVPTMVEIAIFWSQIHITSGSNSLHRKWHTGNQYTVKSTESRMRSNLKLLPVMNVKKWLKIAVCSSPLSKYHGTDNIVKRSLFLPPPVRNNIFYEIETSSTGLYNTELGVQSTGGEMAGPGFGEKPLKTTEDLGPPYLPPLWGSLDSPPVYLYIRINIV